MDAVEALSNFLDRAVTEAKRERYIGFVRVPKTRAKFLASLDHKLERDIDRSVAVPSLSAADLGIPGYLYSSEGHFGLGLNRLKDAEAKASPYGGWIGLSTTGLIGVYRPEGRADDVVFFKL